MFDIKSLETVDQASYQITDAKGAPQFNGTDPITITAYGPGTKVAAQAKFSYEQKVRARTMGEIGGKSSQLTEADERRQRAEYLAQLVQSLDGFEYPGGAAALFANPKLRHIADGFEKWWSDAGNFASGSATDSPSA